MKKTHDKQTHVLIAEEAIKVADAIYKTRKALDHVEDTEREEQAAKQALNQARREALYHHEKVWEAFSREHDAKANEDQKMENTAREIRKSQSEDHGEAREATARAEQRYWKAHHERLKAEADLKRAEQAEALATQKYLEATAHIRAEEEAQRQREEQEAQEN